MSLKMNLQKDQEAPGTFLSLSAHTSSSSSVSSTQSVPALSSVSVSALGSTSNLASVSGLDFHSSSPQLCFGTLPSVSAEGSCPHECTMQERIDIETSLSLQQPFRPQDSQKISCEPDSQKTIPEHESHRILLEQESQRISPKHEDKRMLPEEESQTKFPGLLPEQETQRSFSEQEPQRLFPEQAPQRLFPDQEHQSTFSEPSSQGISSEQEPQRMLPEYASQRLLTEQESQRLLPEEGSQRITSEQEPHSLFPELGSHRSFCEEESGTVFPEQDSHREPQGIIHQQTSQRNFPEQESHRILSQSLQNLAAISSGDPSDHQKSPSWQGLVDKHKPFPFAEDPKSVHSEQQNTESYLGFLKQTNDKSIQISPNRQNTSIFLENLELSSSFQEDSTPEVPAHKAIMPCLQLGQRPLQGNSCQQSPEKQFEPQISRSSLLYSHDKENITSPRGLLDSAAELKSSCVLGTSVQLRSESAQGNSLESMPSGQHVLPSSLLCSLDKENITLRQGVPDHHKSAFTQTNSGKEFKASCMLTSSIQMSPQPVEGMSVDTMPLNQTFPSSLGHSSDKETITSCQGHLQHHKSAFTETHPMKELKVSCMLTSSIQSRPESMEGDEPIQSNQNFLPSSSLHSPNNVTIPSTQIPLGNQKSAFMQPYTMKDLTTSCMHTCSIQTSSGVIQNEAQDIFPKSIASESSQGSSEQSKNTLGHLLGCVSQPVTSILQDKPGVLFSEPIVASNKICQGKTLKEPDSSSSLQPHHASLSLHHRPEQVYPAALATHFAVLEDQNLFLETFRKFHTALGVHVVIPKLGEEDLDLHKLYKEVTNRGGFEKVSKERRWKEIMQAFNTSSSATDASLLRRTYIRALQLYEQVYLFGATGRIAQRPERPALCKQDSKVSQQSLDESENVQYRPPGITDSAQALGVDPASSVGTVVNGTIDGKFDNGYLVTVMVGTRKMRGVLYHVASTNTTPQNASVPGMMQIVGVELKSTDLTPTSVGRKRKKPEVIRKDPNAPRQNRSGYNFFFAEQRARLKTMQPDKDKAISKMIGELWNNLTEDEKHPYQAQGVKDKERYVCEMREYKERAKLPLVNGAASKRSASQAIPIHPFAKAALPQLNSSITLGHPSDTKVASSHVPTSAFMSLASSVASPGSSKSDSMIDMQASSNHE